jgi:hypothetical protein
MGEIGEFERISHKKALGRLTNQVKALPFFPRKKHILGIATEDSSAKNSLCD